MEVPYECLNVDYYMLCRCLRQSGFIQLDHLVGAFKFYPTICLEVSYEVSHRRNHFPIYLQIT